MNTLTSTILASGVAIMAVLGSAEKRPDNFFERWTKHAKVEQFKYDIPASIKLSQMALETGYGSSELYRNANNLTGIKAWGKDPYYKIGNIKYKKFRNKWEGMRAHSEFLLQERYASCFDCLTYECWAKELQCNGYAEDKNYERKLISIIERYNLNKHDITYKK